MQRNLAAWRIGLMFSLLSGILHFAGYALYAIGVWEGGIHTNIVSWSLWALGTIVAYVVYREIAHDWAKSFLNLICVIGMFGIVGMVWYQVYLNPSSYFTWDEGFIVDLGIAVLDIFVMFLWIRFRNKDLGVVDFWFQIDIIVSFIPIIRSTIADPSSETLYPWVLWTLAYLAQYFCVALRPDVDQDTGEVDVESSKRSLNTPLNYLAWHLGMVIILLLGGAALV